MSVTTITPALTGSYTIDPAHSRIGFVARHAMVTKVRGSFNRFTGNVAVDAEQPKNSSVDLVIEVDSIDTRNADRDGHLRTNDFLDVANHPEITFRSNDAGFDGETLELTGDLTVRGVTQQITVPFSFEGAATDPFGNQRLGFEGQHAISRKDYGITWNAALETGGVLVSDKIVLEFEISLVKSA
ncbi:YceI family protein [Streptacidiphilus jiangxiensis]|uniref:Polyisoprenoid-binding protein YceI n=1 Tax=Streptacidiphilus jiangxiensis TaxID=235985 RepID=A0A1H7XBJ1_STRJI|nr:YceI family protein [Streptacidiphilus jiangxiensis]SEM31091.1 Polyisoprenoid-binding protein YceI [Streptacidiphilus jiangxiensis]